MVIVQFEIKPAKSEYAKALKNVRQYLRHIIDSPEVELKEYVGIEGQIRLKLEVSEGFCDTVFDKLRGYLKQKGLLFEGRMGPFTSTVEEELMDIPISEETRERLDACKKQKPDGTKETDNEVIGRLLDGVK